MDLLQQTYKLIDASGLIDREIATGAGVDLNWFNKFRRKKIGSPGVPKVQRVHDFLVAKSVPSRRRA